MPDPANLPARIKAALRRHLPAMLGKEAQVEVKAAWAPDNVRVIVLVVSDAFQHRRWRSWRRREQVISEVIGAHVPASRSIKVSTGGFTKEDYRESTSACDPEELIVMLKRLRRRGAERSDLAKYFLYNGGFFHDGKFFRVEWINGGRDWEIELESQEALNEIADRVGKRGGDRNHIVGVGHKCEDFAFVVTFHRVVHFAITAEPPIVQHLDGHCSLQAGSIRDLSRPQAFYFSEIVDSDLWRKLSRKFKRRLFHLRFETTACWVNRTYDLIFEKVTVRAKDWQKIYAYNGGKRVILKNGIYRPDSLS